MKIGWAGGILVGLLALALPTAGNQGSVFLAGELVTLPHILHDERNRLLVPLEAFGLQAGVEVIELEKEGLTRLHWGKEWAFLPTGDLTHHEGSSYIPLEELIDLIGGAMYRIGEDIHIDIESHALISLETAADRFIARFDGYLPYEMIPSEPGKIRLRFHQCVFGPALEPTTFVNPEGPLTTAIISAAPTNAIDVLLEFPQNLSPQIRRMSTSGFYSVSITFDHRPHVETETEILPDLSYHKIETDFGKGSVKFEILHVKNWRQRYHLRPALPEGGVGALSTAAAMLETNHAQAAISANAFDVETSLPIGLLVIDDTVLSSSDAPRTALGIDLYGRLTFFQPTASLHLRSDETLIPIDDVNRPIQLSELIAYTENYHGTIARGTTQPFRIVKIRADRVVSVQDTPYIIEDPSATLLVTSGDARARLSRLIIGDEAIFDYALDPDTPLITDVVSAGPLLIASGEVVLDTAQSDPPPANETMACTLLATDWYGGLYLLAVSKDQDSVGASYEDILTILHDCPTRIKNALVLASDAFSSLSFREEKTYRDATCDADVAVALLLIPIGR
jgi:hypothetical protein